MFERFTDRSRRVIQLANQEAQRFNHEYIGTEHILLGLVKEGSGTAANVLKNLDVDLRKIRLEVEKLVTPGPDAVHLGKLPQTPRAKKVIEYSVEEARNLRHNYIGTEHLLLGLLREQEGLAAQVLMNLGLKLEEVRAEVLHLLGHQVPDPSAPPVPASTVAGERTPALDSFGTDLTELARQNKLDPVLGRDQEIERILRILSRRSRSIPVLMGEAGVGKTAIIHGLAQHIIRSDVPSDFENVRVIAVILSMVLTKSAEQTEERISALVHEAKRSGTIIVLDPISTLSSGVLDSEVLAYRQFRARAEAKGIRWIATCRTQRTDEGDPTRDALLSTFEPIRVEQLPREQLLDVLRSHRDRLETHHKVQITDGAITSALSLASECFQGTGLPGRSLLLLDDASAKVRLNALRQSPDVRELDVQIEQLYRQKESAVADQDFERGARLRDETFRLKKRKEQILLQRREGGSQVLGTVDEQVIAEVMREMFGSSGKK